MIQHSDPEKLKVTSSFNVVQVPLRRESSSPLCSIASAEKITLPVRLHSSSASCSANLALGPLLFRHTVYIDTAVSVSGRVPLFRPRPHLPVRQPARGPGPVMLGSLSLAAVGAAAAAAAAAGTVSGPLRDGGQLRAQIPMYKHRRWSQSTQVTCAAFFLERSGLQHKRGSRPAVQTRGAHTQYVLDKQLLRVCHFHPTTDSELVFDRHCSCTDNCLGLNRKESLCVICFPTFASPPPPPHQFSVLNKKNVPPKHLANGNLEQ